jgi:hypothetical protein
MFGAENLNCIFLWLTAEKPITFKQSVNVNVNQAIYFFAVALNEALIPDFDEQIIHRCVCFRTSPFFLTKNKPLTSPNPAAVVVMTSPNTNDRSARAAAVKKGVGSGL